MIATRLALPAFAVIAFATAAQAASPLNVRPGLWEMTSTGEATGAPPIPAEYLARMTPEQRAKAEERMRAGMARANQPHVNRQCITTDDLQRGFRLDEENGKGDRTGCSKLVANSTGAVMDVKQSCSAAGQATTMMMHFEAASPETVTGRVEVTMSGAGNMMSVKRNITGKWLGPDCSKR